MNEPRLTSCSPLSSHPAEEDLLVELELRNETTPTIQFGNKLAKPSTTEQTPSAGFVFGKASATAAPTKTNASIYRSENSHDVTLPVEGRIPANVDEHAKSKQRPRSIQKVLDLSIQPAPLEQSSSSHRSNPRNLDLLQSSQHVSQNEHITEHVDVLVSESVSESLSRPQLVRALSSNIDTPTLIKLLAFVYQKEFKQHDELVASLRADIENKADSLSRMEQDYNALQLVAETTQRRIIELENKVVASGQESSALIREIPTDTSITRHLETLQQKIDNLAQQRTCPRMEENTLLSTLEAIRHAAENLKQSKQGNSGRSEKRALSSPVPSATSAVNQDQGEVCLTSMTHVKYSPCRASKEDQSEKVKEPASPQHALLHLKVTQSSDLQSMAIGLPSTPVSKQSEKSGSESQADTVRSGVNKFCKRTRKNTMDAETTGPECQTSSKSMKKTNSVAGGRRIISAARHRKTTSAETSDIRILTELTPNIRTISTSSRPKTARGPGGG